MHDIGAYQKHLNRVSRSFAFCIQNLDSPFRQWTSLSYLLCRVLDTVEDAPWEDPKRKAEQFAEFDEYLSIPPTPNRHRDWRDRFPGGISEGEARLIADSGFLFEDLAALQPDVREAIRNAVGIMGRGMRHYAARETVAVGMRLSSLTDVNRYCYFVAGIVGKLLSRLFLIERPDFRPAPEFMTNAFHFGLFLQKVNLLKDQPEDEKVGRYLVPNREELIASLRENADGALSYILMLPVTEKGFRMFCATSLFLGAATLSAVGARIPRGVTEDLLRSLEEIILNNDELRVGFNDWFPKLPKWETNVEAGVDDWFRPLVQGELGTTELAALKMI